MAVWPLPGPASPVAGRLSPAEEAALALAARDIRLGVVAMAASPSGCHLGGSLSAADILAVLYFRVLRLDPAHPAWEGRDEFVLSKGHASAALYAALAARGFFPQAELDTFGHPKSRLLGHPTRGLPGVEFATGSLGHGLALGVGLALAARLDRRPSRVFVLMGDGELEEGSVWEAALASAHHRLDNLVGVVDRNGLQIDGPTESVAGLEPLLEKWRAFGWGVAEVDGHDVPALAGAFSRLPLEPGRPSLVLAGTRKGRGVSFLEGRASSHHGRLGAEELARARAEIMAAAGDVPAGGDPDAAG